MSTKKSRPKYGQTLAAEDMMYLSKDFKKLTPREVREIVYPNGENLLAKTASLVIINYIMGIYGTPVSQTEESSIMRHYPEIIRWLHNPSDELREEHARGHYSALLEIIGSEPKNSKSIKEVVGYLKIRFPKEIKTLKRGLVV